MVTLSWITVSRNSIASMHLANGFDQILGGRLLDEIAGDTGLDHLFDILIIAVAA